MPRKGINAIPLFCFSVPEVDLWSGPFRDANADATINGSGDMARFLHLFEQLYKHTATVLGATLKRDRAPLVNPGSHGDAPLSIGELVDKSGGDKSDKEEL